MSEFMNEFIMLGGGKEESTEENVGGSGINIQYEINNDCNLQNGGVELTKEEKELFTKIKPRPIKAQHRTVSHEDVPVLFQEAHVYTGFRLMHQPWSYYINSLFFLHNEFMNVWTHIIAFLLTSLQLYYFHCELNFTEDPYSWPLLAGCACGSSLYACSSFAHWAQSRSEFVNYVAFMVDFAGIGLYGFGSVIVHLMYCSEDVFYEAVHTFYIPLGGVLAFLICSGCSIAKVRYSRPYPFQRKLWQIIPVGCIYVVLIAPVMHRIYTCYAYNIDCTDSIPYHVVQIGLFLLSGFFFASDMPQRFYAGKCDIFFHSHQLFHTAIAACTLFQMHAVIVDIRTRLPALRASRPPPTLASAFGPVALVVICEVLCIVFFTFRVSRKLNEAKAK